MWPAQIERLSRFLLNPRGRKSAPGNAESCSKCCRQIDCPWDWSFPDSYGLAAEFVWLRYHLCPSSIHRCSPSSIRLENSFGLSRQKVSLTGLPIAFKFGPPPCQSSSVLRLS